MKISKFLTIVAVSLILLGNSNAYSVDDYQYTKAIDSHETSQVHMNIETKFHHWKVSQYLVGLHFVYTKEFDKIYDDNKVALWAKNAGIHTARFPGGTVVKGWDWRKPLGRIHSDPWDLKSSQFVEPERNWMSLDEYLEFAKISGITPLLGVNYSSGVLYNREHDSVKRAADMVRYVKSRGFSGAYYYIGNEDIGLVGSIRVAAKSFVAHARAMKEVDPAIKIFWNDNNVNPKRLKKYLSIAGKWADGCEFHGKWPYGGKWKKDYYTLSDWQSQNPIRGLKRGVYSERIKILRKIATSAGYPNLMFVNNEYGLNANNKLFVGFSRFTQSLVVIDYLQNLFIGGYDMAAFWSNTGDASFLMDKYNDYRMNPMYIGFEMLAQAQGSIMLRSSIDDPFVRGFAVKSDSSYIIYLLNKSSQSKEVNIQFKDLRLSEALTVKTNMMIDTKDHWGKRVTVDFHSTNNTVKAELPPLTYTQIKVLLK